MTRFLKYMALCAFCVPTASFAAPIIVTDASELDFSGNFVYAVNFFGSGSQTVGDANFTNVGRFGGGSPAGVDISGFNRNYGWGIDLGVGANNDGLENVLNTLIWSDGLDLGEIDLSVEVGTKYRLQLLFGEGCCDTRNFDVDVETSLLNEQVIGTGTGGTVWSTSRTHGYAMVLDFTASDSVLDIDFSRARNGDTNYHISGFTVEKVPEPAPLALLALGLTALSLARRKKA